jgi:hypothetical protein
MIVEAKNALEEAVRSRAPAATIVRSASGESRAIMAREFPVVALVTLPGGFDDREAQTYRYYDSEEGTWKQRYVRGNRVILIEMRVWGEKEEDVDAVFSGILPGVPRHWEYDGLEGLVVINGEEHSDSVDSVSGTYLSAAEIQFSCKIALEEETVPTINTVELEPDTVKLL